MSHDWLLVETLGSEPAVVAEGRRTENLVPISQFLRRHPHLMAIQTAIGETVRGGQGLSSITPKNDRVIRTEVVKMSDGKIHGVHVWIGPPDMEPPERPVPGPLVWDLADGIATDTSESLFNSGWDPEKVQTHGRAFADDLPRRALHPSESKVLSMVIRPTPGTQFCSTWDITDFQGEPITIGFVTRVLQESQDDGSDRLIARSMNWRSEREGSTVPHDNLGEKIVSGLAQSGVHRVLVDLNNWKVLKWLDDPAPFFDWRVRESGDTAMHPDDAPHLARMTIEFGTGTTSGVLRVRANDGGWTPVHMTLNRVELAENTYAGLLALRMPTADELARAGLEDAGGTNEAKNRRAEPSKAKTSKTPKAKKPKTKKPKN